MSQNRDTNYLHFRQNHDHKVSSQFEIDSSSSSRVFLVILQRLDCGTKFQIYINILNGLIGVPIDLTDNFQKFQKGYPYLILDQKLAAQENQKF